MRKLTTLQETYLWSIRRQGVQCGASAYDARIYDALTRRGLLTRSSTTDGFGRTLPVWRPVTAR